MTTLLNGALLNGDLGGTLTGGGGRLANMQVSTTSAMVGTLTLTGTGGAVLTTTAGLNGTQPVGELYGPAFFLLSSAADVGKARVTWSVT